MFARSGVSAVFLFLERAGRGVSAVFLFWRGRGAVCPLCFFFGEGGLCALLFLVYVHHQGATSNLQDRNRGYAISVLSLCYLCAISAIYGRNCPVSYFFVRVISVLSLCYLCYLLLSLCYLLAISVLSLCYLCVISVLPLCYLYGIPTLSQKKWFLSVASPVFWKADCGSFLLCGFHDVLSAFNSLLLRLLWFSGMAAHNHSHKLQMFNASVHIDFPRRAQTICTMCSKKKDQGI